MMIKQDKNQSTVSGSTNLLINECAQIILAVAEAIEENTELSAEEARNFIQQSVTVNLLVRAGMTVEEARDVGDPTGNIIKMAKSIDEFTEAENE